MRCVFVRFLEEIEDTKKPDLKNKDHLSFVGFSNLLYIQIITMHSLATLHCKWLNLEKVGKTQMVSA